MPYETNEIVPAPIAEWQDMKEKALVLLKSGFMPKAINTVDKVLTVALTGKELGLPLMQSLRGIHVIDQVPVIKPELLLALCIQRINGFKFWWGKSDNTEAHVFISRPEMNEPFESVFTIEDAKKAGLLSKSNWNNYPANMLRWRALANALHATCPEVLVGIYTPDEIQAETTQDGEIIEAEHKVIEEKRDEKTGELLPVYICAGCGDEISDVTLKSGKPMTALEVLQACQKDFGENLCYACGLERHKMARKAEKEQKQNEL